MEYIPPKDNCQEPNIPSVEYPGRLLTEYLSHQEGKFLAHLMMAVEHDAALAAKILDISRSAFYRLLAKHHIPRRPYHQTTAQPGWDDRHEQPS